MTLQLLGLGTASPPHTVEQADAATIVKAINGATDKQRRFIEEVYAHAGVHRRGSVVLNHSDGPLEARQTFFQPPRHPGDLGPTTAERMQVYAEAAPRLAVSAAERALTDAAVSSREITHLVTVSCTGFDAPGVDLRLIQQLGLNASVARTHVGFMGCHAALNALRVVQAFTTANPSACVLVVCVELCSLHHQYAWAADQVVANALFADGAAAVVCRASKPDNQGGWNLIASGSTILPDTAREMSWRIGDHGFAMTLSKRLPEIVRTHLKPWLTAWLGEHERTLADVASWAIHPGGPKVINACEEALALPSTACEPSRTVLANYGNVSSATVLFVLEQLRQSHASLPCVALAFGPGVAIEAAVFE
jgi:predicted naringenin-chalcone synthase